MDKLKIEHSSQKSFFETLIFEIMISDFAYFFDLNKSSRNMPRLIPIQ